MKKNKGNKRLRIAYAGDALDSGEIGIQELGGILISVGSLFHSTNKEFNQKRADLEIKTKAFKDGSFEIILTLSQTVLDKAASFLISKEVVSLVTLISLLGFGKTGLFQIIKLIKGRRIKRKEEKNNFIKLILDDGEEMEVHKDIYALYQNPDVRKAIEGIVKPLDKDGIDVFEIRTDGNKNNFKISSKEKSYFTANIDKNILSDKEKEIYVTVNSLSFKKENKWQLNDGGVSFYVKIEDRHFLDKISNNEVSFSKDDILKVKMREIQYTNSFGELKVDKIIIKVLEHKISVKQQSNKAICHAQEKIPNQYTQPLTRF